MDYEGSPWRLGVRLVVQCICGRLLCLPIIHGVEAQEKRFTLLRDAVFASLRPRWNEVGIT